LPLSALKLARILRREKFDIVQSHVFSTMFTARPAAWLADVPVRLAMISGPFHLEAYTSRWVDQATWWMETAIIASCELSVRLCREMGVPDDRLALIYYGADEQIFDPQTAPANIRAEFGWPPETKIVSQVAIFYPRLLNGSWIPEIVSGRGVKGHEDVVNAAPNVLKEFPDAKFLLVGSGWGEAGEKYLQEIKDLVAEKGLQDSVVFLGYRTDTNRILVESNVGVQASLSENLGGIIEGFLMECPMVATRIGGMPDAVWDDWTGVLVNPKDPEDLARGIIQQLRDPQKARAMAVNGRKLMLDRFTLTRTVADEAELYQRCLEQKAQRRFYNPLVSLWRLIVAAPVYAYIVIRLVIIDMFIPIYLPIYRARVYNLVLRAFYVPVRIFYRVGGRAYRAVGRVYRAVARG